MVKLYVYKIKVMRNETGQWWNLFMNDVT